MNSIVGKWLSYLMHCKADCRERAMNGMGVECES